MPHSMLSNTIMRNNQEMINEKSKKNHTAKIRGG